MATERVLSALGAYGRPARREDWDKGLDFKAYSGPYFSIRDLALIKEHGWTKIEFKHGGIVQFEVIPQ